MTSGGIIYQGGLYTDKIIKEAGVFTNLTAFGIVTSVSASSVYKYGVYISTDDQVLCVSKENPNKEPEVYDYSKMKAHINETFTFFDQSHIVGVDKRCTYSKTAQGIFRMRNINKGQTADIMHDKVGNSKMKLPMFLINNELENMDNVKNYYKKKYCNMIGAFILIMGNHEHECAEMLENSSFLTEQEKKSIMNVTYNPFYGIKTKSD